MIKQLKPKSEFSRNVINLITGTTIAQAIPFAAAPILTRLYSPEEFGMFAFYSAIVSIFAVLATARYELAIVLPKRKSDAYQIVILSWAITTIISFFAFLFIWLLDYHIVRLLNNPNIAQWLYWIPISIFLMGIYQPLYYWFNREKEYKHMANSRIVQSSALAASQIFIGLLTKLSASGLILGQLTAQIIASFYMGRKFFKNTYGAHKPHKLKQLVLAKKYINFPKFLLVSHTMNAASRQLPNIFFNILLTASVAGYYLLVQRVIGVPMTVVGGAIGDVFRQEASQAYAERGECKAEYKSTLKKLLLISIAPFAVFFFKAPDLFAMVFGAECREAGEYARILTPMFMLQFISSPLANMYLIAKKQKEDLYLNSLIFIFTFFPFLLVYYFSIDITRMLYMFSFIYSFLYLINLFMTYRFTKGAL